MSKSGFPFPDWSGNISGAAWAPPQRLGLSAIVDKGWTKLGDGGPDWGGRQKGPPERGGYTAELPNFRIRKGITEEAAEDPPKRKPGAHANEPTGGSPGPAAPDLDRHRG